MSVRGFTVVELMVVVAIVAIFLALAVPSYNGVITQNRMASEINDLANAMSLARSGAIRQGVNVTICASTNPTAAKPSCSGNSNWSTGWILFTDVASNQTYNTSSGDTLLGIHGALQNNDTLTGSTGAVGAYSGSVASVTFNRMGATIGADNLTTTTFDVLTLHDSANTLAWRRCLLVSEVGTSQISTQTQNPGDDCP